MPEADEKDKKEAIKKNEDSLLAVLLKGRNIFLTGEVNKEMTDRVCKQLLLLNQESATQAIKIYIDSPGG